MLSVEKEGLETWWRQDAGKGAEVGLAGPSHKPLSPSLPTHLFHFLSCQPWAAWGRPEAEKGIRNVEKLGHEEVGLSQTVRN